VTLNKAITANYTTTTNNIAAELLNSIISIIIPHCDAERMIDDDSTKAISQDIDYLAFSGRTSLLSRCDLG